MRRSVFAHSKGRIAPPVAAPGGDGIKMESIAGDKTYNRVEEAQAAGMLRRRLLEVEFRLACIDSVVRQRSAEVIHCQSRTRLILWQMEYSMSCQCCETGSDE